MKKNLIAVAIAGVFAVPFAAQAASHMGASSIEFSGDARVQYLTNTPDEDPDGASGKEAAVTKSRVRLGFVAKDGDAASVHYKGYLSNGTHGAFGTGGMKTDYGFVKANVGPVTLSGGLMVAKWGTGLITWDARPNRFMISGKAAGHTINLAWDKTAETDKLETSSPETDDTNMHLMVVGASYGLIYTATTNDNVVDAKGKARAQSSSTAIDVYYKGAAGDVNYNVELKSLGGDTDGMTIGANMMMPLGGVNLAAALIQQSDGGAGLDGDYFDSFFMSCDNGNLCIDASTDEDEDSMLIAVSLGMGMGEGLKGHLSFASITGDGATAEGGTMIELAVMKSISKKSNVRAFYGTVAQDDTTENKTATGMGLAINTKF